MRRKKIRYGDGALAISLETYGRWSQASIDGVKQLATSVARSAVHAGRTPGRRLYERWRVDLETVLLRDEADTMLISLGALAAKTAATPGTATPRASEAAEGGAEEELAHHDGPEKLLSERAEN